MATPPTQAPTSSVASLGEKLLARLGPVPRDLLLAAAITAIAAVPRLVAGADPPGLHGDEAFGLEARRILETGNIGAMSGVATGTPAGTFYWTAALFRLFGDSLYTLRLAYALLGILTIPVAYFAYRVMFGRTTAVLGAALLACSAWQIHFSRVAMCLSRGPWLKQQPCWRCSWRCDTKAALRLAGGALAPAYIPTAGNLRRRLRRVVVWLASTTGGACRSSCRGWCADRRGPAVGLPYSYAHSHPDDYLRIEPIGLAILSTTQRAASWARILVAMSGNTSTADRGAGADTVDGAGVSVLAGRCWGSLCRAPRSACALAKFPPFLMSSLIGLAGHHHRGDLPADPDHACVSPLLAWCGNGRGRTALAVAPRLHRSRRWVTASIVCPLYVVATIHRELRYATELRNASEFSRASPTSLTSTSLLDVGPSTIRHVILARTSGRGPLERVRAFPAGCGPGQDVIYLFYRPILMGTRTCRLPGTAFEQRDENGNVVYRAYLLPRVPGAASPTPVATRTPEGTARSDRDEVRVRDLASLRRALDQYRAQHGSYPDTGGAVQPVCALPTSDAGCTLGQVLDPLPADPLGNAVNGYWYCLMACVGPGPNAVRLFPDCQR
jgi:hypothetical protein